MLITLNYAKRMHKAYINALKKYLKGPLYSINGSPPHHSLEKDIRNRIDYWERLIKTLASSGGVTIQHGFPCGPRARWYF